MSNYDYKKISNNQNDDEPKEVFSGLSQIESENEEPMEESVLTTTVNVEEVPSEQEESHEETVEQSVEEPEEIVEHPLESQPAATTKIGIVDGCDKLNVRQSPSADAKPIGQPLNKSAKVAIDEANSTDDFYKVYLSTGLVGYCMKEFIKIVS